MAYEINMPFREPGQLGFVLQRVGWKALLVRLELLLARQLRQIVVSGPGQVEEGAHGLEQLLVAGAIPESPLTDAPVVALLVALREQRLMKPVVLDLGAFRRVMVHALCPIECLLFLFLLIAFYCYIMILSRMAIELTI